MKNLKCLIIVAFAVTLVMPVVFAAAPLNQPDTAQPTKPALQSNPGQSLSTDEYDMVLNDDNTAVLTYKGGQSFKGTWQFAGGDKKAHFVLGALKSRSVSIDHSMDVTVGNVGGQDVVKSDEQNISINNRYTSTQVKLARDYQMREIVVAVRVDLKKPPKNLVNISQTIDF